MSDKERKQIASVINTLRRVQVCDGDDNNLTRMAACINTLLELVKEGTPSEDHG